MQPRFRSHTASQRSASTAACSHEKSRLGRPKSVRAALPSIPWPMYSWTSRDRRRSRRPDAKARRFKRRAAHLRGAVALVRVRAAAHTARHVHHRPPAFTGSHRATTESWIGCAISPRRLHSGCEQHPVRRRDRVCWSGADLAQAPARLRIQQELGDHAVRLLVTPTEHFRHVFREGRNVDWSPCEGRHLHWGTRFECDGFKPSSKATRAERE